MYRNHAVAAVVAARNEAPFIDDVVDAMPAFVDRIYVVDDASEDDTRAVALGAAAGSPATSPRSGAPSGAGSTAESPRPIRRVAAVLSHDEQRGAGAVKRLPAALDGDAGSADRRRRRTDGPAPPRSVPRPAGRRRRRLR